MDVGIDLLLIDKKLHGNNNSEYQIERLHIYGDQHPESGLKNKVKRWQFKQSIDIVDPISKEIHKEPLKQFMVNQLLLSFERSRIMLSPFDEVLPRQLNKYEVVRTTEDGLSIFTSEDEHFIDALGLAHLAFVLEFKELTNTIKDAEVSSKISCTNASIMSKGLSTMFNEIQESYGIHSKVVNNFDDDDEPRKTFIKVTGYGNRPVSRSWGSRNSNRGFVGRSMW